MDWLMMNWATLIQIVTGVVTTASIIVKLTPSTKDDAVVAKIMQFLALTPKR